MGHHYANVHEVDLKKLYNSTSSLHTIGQIYKITKRRQNETRKRHQKIQSKIDVYKRRSN